MTAPRREGFSLLEVMLASAILVGCLAVLSELANIGRIHATVAQDGGTAERICQSKVNEILAGLAPASPVHDEPVEDAPGWVCSVDVDSVRQRGVVALRVTVKQDDDSAGRPMEFSLVRWIRDPKWTPGGPSAGSREMRISPGFRGRRGR